MDCWNQSVFYYVWYWWFSCGRLFLLLLLIVFSASLSILLYSNKIFNDLFSTLMIHFILCFSWQIVNNQFLFQSKASIHILEIILITHSHILDQLFILHLPKNFRTTNSLLVNGQYNMMMVGSSVIAWLVDGPKKIPVNIWLTDYNSKYMTDYKASICRPV